MSLSWPWRKVNHKLDAILRLLQQERIDIMSSAADITRLQSDVAANTNATSAAAVALTGFVSTVAALTAQLQAAINSDDSAAVEAAANALEANNVALTAAVPATAAAVVANTPAAGA